MPGHRNTGCFDLFGAYLPAFSSLQTEFSKIQCAAPTGDTSHFSFLLFSKFYLFGAQHFLVSYGWLCIKRYALSLSGRLTLNP
jgi:hypothetical protein